MAVPSMVMPAAVAGIIAIGGVVRVAMERPLQHEHQKEARQYPLHRGIDLPVKLQECMRQKVEQADPEQHTPGERKQHLHPAMPHGKK